MGECSKKLAVSLLSGVAFFSAAAPAASQVIPAFPKAPFPSQAELSQACALGSGASAKGASASGYDGSGLTPARAGGAITVSAKEAKCVIDRYPDQVLIINALGDTPQIKDSLDMRWAVKRSMTPEEKGELNAVLGNLLRNAKSAPIIVYCHHESCGPSYFVAKDIAELGYSNVLWMREGIQGWQKQGFPISSDATKWSQPLLDASKSLLDCYNAQPVPGLEAVDTVKARIQKSCSTQQASLRSSIGRWYPERMVTATFQSVSAQFDRSLLSTIEHKQAEPRRIEDERKKKEERAAFDAKWKRQQGIGVPERDLRAGFEFCHIRLVHEKETGVNSRGRPEISHSYTVYVSEIYPEKIGKEGYDTLSAWPSYNSYQNSHLTERSTSFARLALGKHPDVERYFVPACHFSKTLNEAQEARNRIITENSYPKVHVSKQEWPQTR